MGFSFLAFPNEVLMLILSFMRKRELKSLRLMCRFLETISAPLLFRRVYFSGFHEDLKVLEAVSQHQRLRHFVKEIVCCSFYARQRANRGGIAYRSTVKRAVRRFPNVQSLITTNYPVAKECAQFVLDSPLQRNRVLFADGVSAEIISE